MTKISLRVLDWPTALFMVGLSVIGCPLQAQEVAAPLPDPSVTLSLKQGATFEAALQAVAAQAHVAIFAEGAPLLRQQPSPTLLALPPRSPVSAAVEALAKDYDYDVQRQDRIFLLVKRYSDPNDLPDVTPEECALALDDMVQVMSALDPGPPEMGGPGINPQLVRIAASLTPVQIQAMEQKTAYQGLSIASLSDVSRFLVRQFVLTHYVDDQLDEVKKARYQLGLAASAALYVKKSRQVSTRTTRVTDGPPLVQTIVQDTSFGFDRHDNGLTWFFPLDENAEFIASGSNQPPVKISAPLPEPPSSAVGYTTLGFIAKVLAVRGTRVIVSPALAAKTLTTCGADAMDPEKIMKAAATIYDLRYFRDEEGRRRLTRLPIRVPLTVAGLPDAVRRALPAPILRALHDGEAEREHQEQQTQAASEAPQSEADVVRLMQEQSQREKKIMARYSLPDTLHRIAIAHLSAAFHAKLTQQGTTVKQELAGAQTTRRISLASLPLAARSAFAVALMTDLLEWTTHQMGQKAPQWAADPDMCYLTGGLQPNPTRPGTQIFTMGISVADTNGSLSERIVTATDYMP